MTMWSQCARCLPNVVLAKARTQPRDLSIAGGADPERPIFVKLLPGVMGPGFRQDDIGDGARSPDDVVEAQCFSNVVPKAHTA
ncbi:hypothetical protein AYJ54_22425 [Bradyrhizobium centrolobii]|uniref:Uncharacterized protein n=1 Tax=Bradyrhizobium centrolobii TaxID=1505087 RepID=A0A176YHQ8_9BRAD|nr:hypothetical protein AYJ54_22425 [Bradyrhizobium centrolobii]